jgi:two-component system response regulator HydG
MQAQTTHWRIHVQDPSGESRRFPAPLPLERLRIGRAQDCEIPLRDSTAAPRVASLALASSKSRGLWLSVDGDAPAPRLGDLSVREAELPPGIPLIIGDSRILLEDASMPEDGGLPEFPSGVRAWHTASEQGRQVLWITKKAAATPLSVYLAGETGVGKEVIAQLVHSWSERASGPFVPLHCGALPLSLAESELFGHVKGAFTGATHPRPGALLQAHGGTLFLDEVGDLPLDIQVKLLRFLENGEIRPVGADRTTRADARIVCATHHPLRKLVEEGKFRRDLYYRLASVTIEIPSLRSRPEDIELLARRFARELSRDITPRAMLRLQGHVWPGNVRELRHAIERASGLAGPFVSSLGEEAFGFLLQSDPIDTSPDLGAVLSLDEMERTLLIKALRLSGGNRSRAATILGVARSTLFEMLKRHRIPGPKATLTA